MENGLILVNTGNGKGKTTAALGLCFRAIGHDMKVLMLSFIKNAQGTGEVRAAKLLGHNFKMVQLGRGFIRTQKGNFSEETIKNATESWEYAKQEIFSDEYDTIVLDEINILIDYGLLSVEDVISVLRNKPRRLNIVLTGRNAKDQIIEIADLVTEMKEIKHPYKKGIKARKGIEF
ncbi:MAG: cob(I)yrinic acid a,c-diamide adenosyltransferase [Candidatus Kuenenia sp.]|nr:cob(I)yrinic acid a,c-diamide adenosyltransferase [Candidatus Kuenenia hertensis]